MTAQNAQTKKRLARPEKTESQRGVLFDALREGMNRESSCMVAQIPRRTFYLWLSRDEDFRAAVELAECGGMRELVRNIRKASDVTWQAAAWLLERRWPQEWGRIDRQPAPPEQQSAPVVINENATPEELAAAARKVLGLEKHETP